MLMTWSKDAPLLKIGVVLAEDCIDMTVVSTKEELECWETKYDSKLEGLSGMDRITGATTITWHIQVR
jgi:hypothetical protein